MFSRFSRPLTIASCLVFAGAAPVVAADYGDGCNFGCGGVGYDYSNPGGNDRLTYDPDSPYFLSDTDQAAANPHENFALRGSIGIASIKGQEHVYAGTSGTQNLSLLVWEGSAPVASLDGKARFDGWTLRGHIEAALPGGAKMTDYDWIPPYNTGYGMDDWSDRSISPTSLDWYWTGDIALGRDLPINDALTVNVNGGFKYTDAQWTAVGGTYIYSTGGFRNDIGVIPDVPAVRYRQQLPVLFAGVEATVNDGAWNLEAGGRAGLIIYGQARDDHYLRVPPRYTIDQMSWGQMLSADAKLGYAFNDHLSAFVEGSYEKTFAAHVPKEYRKISDGTFLLPTFNIGGGELDVATIKAGLKGNF
jgi:outer membrane protease